MQRAVDREITGKDGENLLQTWDMAGTRALLRTSILISTVSPGTG
jgi:hypothetical protein